MTITRDGKNIELTRQELFDAHEAYEYLTAREVVAERLTTKFDSLAITDAVIEAAVETYLNDKQFGCEEDFCINEMMETAAAKISGM